jgi:hypothetical protein
VGRSKWILGGYSIAQPRLDSDFSTEDTVRTYLHREAGALGTFRYPIGPFSYFDLELRTAAVSRGSFSDPVLEPLWNSQNPGTEFLLAPMVRVGWDHILYEAFTGPLDGGGVLLDLDTSYYPHRDSASQRLRLDTGYYVEIVGRTVLAIQTLTGVSFGGRFNNPFFVSSDDIMRAYPFGDPRLYGNYLLSAKADLRFPIGDLFKFPPLRGLVSYDVGALSAKSASLFEHVAEAYSFGFGLNIPPISFNFIFSYPLREAPGPHNSSVFHFTLRYLYM